MFKHNQRFLVTAICGLTFGFSMLAAVAQEAAFKPFELDVKQTELFGRPSSVLLQGGIDDTIRGALLKTVQEKKTTKTGKASYSPGYTILKPTFAPDLSGQVATAQARFMPDLTARGGAKFDLPTANRDLSARIELRDTSRQNADLTALQPKTAPSFDLEAKKQDPQDFALQERKPIEAPVLAASAPNMVPDIAAPRAVSVNIPEPTPRARDFSNAVKPRRSRVIFQWAPVPEVAADKAIPDLLADNKTAVALPVIAGGAKGSLNLETRSSVAADLIVRNTQATLDLRPKQALDLPVKAEPVVAVKIELPKRVSKPEPVVQATQTVAAKPLVEKKIREKVIEARPVKPVIVKEKKPKLKVNEKILWDQWYERVGKLFDSNLVATLERYDNPAGRSVISVTIRSDHKVGAVSCGGSNQSFIDATLCAYRSLSGHPSLAFPYGSRKREVCFQVTNSQDEEGPIIVVEGKRITGDTEITESK